MRGYVNRSCLAPKRRYPLVVFKAARMNFNNAKNFVVMELIPRVIIYAWICESLYNKESNFSRQLFDYTADSTDTYETRIENTGVKNLIK